MSLYCCWTLSLLGLSCNLFRDRLVSEVQMHQAEYGASDLNLSHGVSYHQ